MGQYYLLINEDKKEYVCPYCIDGVAKAFEWCANIWAGIIAYLILKTDSGGGGDPDWEKSKYAGKWAENRVMLIGDYDSSQKYDLARKKYKNISIEAGEEFYRFIGEDKKLHLCLSCSRYKQK